METRKLKGFSSSSCLPRISKKSSSLSARDRSGDALRKSGAVFPECYASIISRCVRTLIPRYRLTAKIDCYTPVIRYVEKKRICVTRNSPIARSLLFALSASATLTNDADNVGFFFWINPVCERHAQHPRFNPPSSPSRVTRDRTKSSALRLRVNPYGLEPSAMYRQHTLLFDYATGYGALLRAGTTQSLRLKPHPVTVSGWSVSVSRGGFAIQIIPGKVAIYSKAIMVLFGSINSAFNWTERAL